MYGQSIGALLSLASLNTIVKNLAIPNGVLLCCFTKDRIDRNEIIRVMALAIRALYSCFTILGFH